MSNIIADRDKYYTSARIYSAIESTFAHWDDVPELVHGDLFKSYIEAISQSTSRSTFVRETQRYMAQFRNAHTEFVDTTVYERGDITFGFYARLIEDEWVITTSAHSDIRPGDVICRIEDQSASDFLRPYNDLISASRQESKSYTLWRRPFFLPEDIEIELSSGTVKRICKGMAPDVRRPAVEAGYLGKVPVITIRSFDDPDFEDTALSYVNQHKDAPALILDIRGNGGGNTPENLINALMNVPFSGWRDASPFRLGVDIAVEQLASHGQAPAIDRSRVTLSWNSPVRQPRSDAYQGDVFIVHDIGTKSAAEDFLMPFKVTGRATLVGETTCGSSGQPYIDTPFAGVTYAIGAKRQTFPNGDRFEGVGIAPDLEVGPTQARLRSNKDYVLDELKKIL